MSSFNGQVIKKSIGVTVNTEVFRNKAITKYSSYLAIIIKVPSIKETKNIKHQKKDLKFRNYIPKTYENNSYDNFIDEYISQIEINLDKPIGLIERYDKYSYNKKRLKDIFP